jgi:gamma-glutamyltranspeptidase/glutathione hydrolase
MGSIVRYTLSLMRLQLISLSLCKRLPASLLAATRAALLAPAVALVVFALGFPVARPAWSATPEPLRAAHGAVASDHVEASAAGVELMRAGGNAADAACATALALGVVNPQSSGVGGGGFAVIYVAKEKKSYVIDFRETAPAAIKPELYFRDGKPAPELSRRGGLAVGVPGEVRGLGELVKRFGKKSFADCVKPAERLAKGFHAGERLADSVSGDRNKDPQMQQFLKETMTFEAPLKEGAIVRRPALGATLRRLREAGPDALYTGKIAAEIVKAVKAAGGVMTVEDLAGYKVIDRTPIESPYRSYRVVSMPPPSSGGIVIAEVLGILAERVKDPSTIARGSSAYLHVLSEALKHGFADRARLLGDADFVDIPLTKLLDPAYHKTLAARIDDKGVLPPERYGLGATGTGPPKDGGTAHLSIIDAEGNAVALTTTVNLGFGAHVLPGPTGIVLNNEMDDFSIAPGTPNAFGLVGSAQNAVAPGKRPLSSMAPTIVLEGDKVKMVVGGAGGPTIISGTLQVLLNVLDGKMDVQEASAAPRIHHQWKPNVLVLESEIPRDVIENLEKRGNKTATRGHLTLVNAVVRTADGIEAAAEFRGGGAPAGY